MGVQGNLKQLHTLAAQFESVFERLSEQRSYRDRTRLARPLTPNGLSGAGVTV